MVQRKNHCAAKCSFINGINNGKTEEFHELDIRPSMEVLKIPFLFSSLFSILIISKAVDTITKSHSITGSQTIVSSGGSFEMGFFSPDNSQNQYLGILYKKIFIKTVVWVANRETPLIDSSGVLKVINPGILALVNGTSSVIWSPNVTRSTQDHVAQLMESGNLVVKDVNDNILWQSFDYPCDTLLPGMKLGKNFVTGQERHLSSWKSSDDPAQGDFSFWCDPQGYPQLILRNGSIELHRSGPWNGLGFSGRPNLKPNSIYKYGLVFTEEEVYYGYELINNSVVSRFALSHNGIMQCFTWIDRTQEWVLYLSSPTDNCDYYKRCGSYGSCNIENIPVCSCLSKFVPKYPKQWENRDWSDGCVRRTPLDCRNGDGFLKYSHYKMPDTRYSSFNKSMTLRECELVCLKNCSCTAYTNLDIRGGGSGCLLWFDELIDMREFSENGQDIYIRMASSELDVLEGDGDVGLGGELVDLVGEDGGEPAAERGGVGEVGVVELQEGLVGVVGVDVDVVDSLGVEVRRPSDQAVDLVPFLQQEFGQLGISITLHLQKKKKNLQLNREGNLMLNSEEGYNDKSQKEDLELPLFDFAVIANSTNNFSIDNKLGEGGFGPVYKGILEGGQEIAVKRLSKNSNQGLDEFKNEVICIAKLQHRNLVKLLGCCIQGEEKMLIYEYMPNKSLDFFIFGSGYIAPEYAVDGLFSVKSNVFNFGVLVLEIVSRKRNRGFYHPSHRLNLLGHAWRLYKEGRSLELIDEALWDSCYLNEVLRSIHVGLLCVQQCPEDRPSMSSVVLMLGSEGALPQVKQPGFFTERNIHEVGCSSSKDATVSANEITITLLDAR
ncbi:unnamed protein product [Camellia sinensis]